MKDLTWEVPYHQIQTETNERKKTHTNDETITSKIRSDIIRPGVQSEIPRLVLRKKLAKMRHLVIEKAISPDYLDELFPKILAMFKPQIVTYNGGRANIKEWKISCYLEVLESGVPCTNPKLDLRDVCLDLLNSCDLLFASWYHQQHPNVKKGKGGELKTKRLMTFITRYTAAPNEQALLKHIDGAGKVDGSVVVALPIDRWSSDETQNSFEGFGGGLTFWDGKKKEEIHYDTRNGDIAFIDKALWHQADPITKGTRWALVIFYKVFEE